jgi:hypothetical protein
VLREEISDDIGLLVYFTGDFEIVIAAEKSKSYMEWDTLMNKVRKSFCKLIAPEDEHIVLQEVEDESEGKTLIGSVQELRDMLPDLS